MVDSNEERTVFALGAIVLRRKRLIIGLVVTAFALVVAIWFLRGQEYVAESRFRPSDSGAGDAARLSGLASQLGISAALPADKDNVDFYAELLKSRTLIGAVASDTYSVSSGRETYMQVYGIRGDDPRATMQKAVQHLNERVAVTPLLKPNVVRVRVRARTANLAEQLNRGMLDRVNEFNLERRQSRGRAEREFTARQLKEAQLQLESAERVLERWLEENRRFDSSPELRFAHARLERRVQLRQQLFTSLSEAYEKARIEEVKDIPVITVIDVPEGSAKRNSSLFKTLVMSFVPILVLVLAIVISAEYLADQKRRRPGDYADFRRLASNLLPSKSRE